MDGSAGEEEDFDLGEEPKPPVPVVLDLVFLDGLTCIVSVVRRCDEWCSDDDADAGSDG